MGEILIRQAKLSDVPAISRIEVDSFDSPWSAKEITKDVTAGGGIYFVVAVDGSECVGFAEMRSIAGEAQIYNIAVAEEARGRGVGEALFRHLIDKAEESGCDVVNLEVRAGNEAAIGLYRKLGFVEVGRRRKYYYGKEDAILMDLDLRKVQVDVVIEN
ncbi:MAG: ribosomal protein S18-alanine N-acetyltransferase [Mogibacterium sp.]|nr:ribosomal protein S18-alanine N-acetyltransferase [Mogibacterium sp.]